MIGNAFASISIVTLLPIAISDAWPARPKPVMSVQACTPSTLAIASAAALFNVRICATARSIRSSEARPNLIAVPTMPVPRGLVRIRSIAGLRAGVGENAFRIDGAGDRVAELDLAVLDGVAAEQRDAGLAQLVEAAAENLRDVVGVKTVLRETPRSRAR